MLIQAITQTTLGNTYILQDNDDLNVAAGVVLRSTWTDPETRTGADAILAWTGTHKITVAGTIYGADEAINLVGCTTAQTVTITSTGRLFGGGDGVVEDADGVILDGVGSKLVNAGIITAYGSALSLIVADGGTTTVSNSGTLIGRVAGVWHKWGGGTLSFTNTGIVESPNFAFLGGISTDNVFNKGTFRGAVDLAGGNDMYDGRTGTVTGSIAGGDGNDRFLLGRGAETVDGGAGIDLLDYTKQAGAITIDLSNNANNLGTGVVGDIYTNIENVSGGSYADRLTGDAMDNLLRGFGGADTLSGGLGNDTLEGGASRDVMTGGLGADSFVFTTPGGIGDIITDFTTAQDRVQVLASGFGYGTTRGTLAAADFVSGLTNLAADATDRFIFRTSDATLWFDADGTGTRSTVLIADMQNGISLTAADIFLV